MYWTKQAQAQDLASWNPNSNGLADGALVLLIAPLWFTFQKRLVNLLIAGLSVVLFGTLVHSYSRPSIR